MFPSLPFRLLSAVLALGCMLGEPSLPTHAQGDASWLDEPLSSWNVPGMAIPVGRPDDIPGPNELYCQAAIRPVETAEDALLAAVGWTLTGTYEGGWGVTTVLATTGFDGMCRPIGYHYFVFVDGQFAGTIAPQPMVARTSGAGTVSSRFRQDGLIARFVRYSDTDPLCCPSLPSVSVTYRIDRTERGPVLVPERATAGS